MILDPNDVLFSVSSDGEIFLCIGSIYVKVCSSAKDFAGVHAALLKQLDDIKEEIETYHL